MAKLSNTPPSQSVLELEARKSFTFALQVMHEGGAPVDLTSAAVTFTLGRHGEYNEPPTVILERAGNITAPADGAAVFSLQAAELDLAPGEYPFAVTLRVSGYSLLLAKGAVAVRQNVEYGSTSQTYPTALPSTGLLAELRGQYVLRVITTAGLPGGLAGGLSAGGVPLGQQPTALGDGTWEWRPGNSHEHDAGQVTSGTLAPARIGNYSILLDKVVLPGADNLIPNGMFETNTVVRWDPWLVWDTTNPPPGRSGSLRTSAATSRTIMAYLQQINQGGFELDPYAEYEFELLVRADKPNSKLYVEVRDDTGAQAMNWYMEGSSTASMYPVAAWDVPTTWTRYRARGTSRVGVTVRAQLAAWYFNHSAGTEKNANIWVGGVRIRRRLAQTNYVDAQDTATLATAKTYADTGDSATLVAAKADATTKDTALLTTAKAYTDTTVASSAAAIRAERDLQIGARYHARLGQPATLAVGTYYSLGYYTTAYTDHNPLGVFEYTTPTGEPRYVVKKSGLYQIRQSLQWGGGTTGGTRKLHIFRNGGAAPLLSVETPSGSAGYGIHQVLTGTLGLTAGDYITAGAISNGVACDIVTGPMNTGTGYAGSDLDILYLGPAPTVTYVP